MKTLSNGRQLNPDDLKFDEECALKAILALKDAKSPMLRGQRKTLALAWYSCYYGITNKNDRTPRFQGRTNKIKAEFDLNYILKTHFVSFEAISILEAKEPNTDLRLEHVIPWKVVDQKLQETEVANIEQLRNFLVQNLLISFISLEEDRRLNLSGFNQAMPQGTSDSFARYHAVEPKIKGAHLRNPSNGQPTPEMEKLQNRLRG